MTPAEYEELLPFFCQVANDIRRSNPLVDRDDLIQECFLWTVSHPRKFAEYRGDEDEKQGDRKLYGALRNACRAYARQDKAARLGYHPDDEVFYGVLVLKDELLPAVYDEDAWLPKNGVHSDTPRSGADPAHGNNWVTTLADVSAALSRLSAPDRDLIEWVYRDGTTQAEIAAESGVSQTTVSRWLDKAVRKLHQELGGSKPHVAADEEDVEPVGSRRAISNAHARAKTGEDYAA